MYDVALVRMNMQRKSEYFANLIVDSQRRYESKVISSGLNIDPYAIDDSQWTEEPAAVLSPAVRYDDLHDCYS